MSLTDLGQTVVKTFVVGLVVGLAGGLGFGWKHWRPKSAVETPAPAVRQSDGSMVLARQPDASTKPAQEIPVGATVERVVQVKIQPRRPGPSAEAQPPTAGPGPQGATPSAPSTETAPVSVDLTLVRMPDKTERVIASSPDGTVVGGVDIPMTPVTFPRQLNWAAGAIYGNKTYGAFVDRDMAFLRLGAEITRQVLSAGPQWDLRVRAGIRF